MSTVRWIAQRGHPTALRQPLIWFQLLNVRLAYPLTNDWIVIQRELLRRRHARQAISDRPAAPQINGAELPRGLTEYTQVA